MSGDGDGVGELDYRLDTASLLSVWRLVLLVLLVVDALTCVSLIPETRENAG